jgi:hydroxylamine reductase
VSRDPIPGKAILISGHDIGDTYELLKQTEGKGINVYTHGELLPAHAYPELKKFPHFAGHYGGAWQLQRAEFPFFPGPIILTTNCLMEPRKSYADRVYTANSVGFTNIKRVENRDFSKVISHALALDGFTEEECKKKDESNTFLTGFGHNAILSQAGAILDAIKAGKLKHFFVVGGCDGASEKRSYFHDLVASTPSDSVVITLACGKYRFNDMWKEMGDIGGIPRLLDMGQCNDAFGAVKVASTLASVLNTDVNSLPISYAISWYEQKAVAVLLSLLHLGIQRIHLGPNLPAFITPNVLQVLVDKFAIRPVGNVEEDLARFLGPK